MFGHRVIILALLLWGTAEMLSPELPLLAGLQFPPGEIIWPLSCLLLLPVIIPQLYLSIAARRGNSPVTLTTHGYRALSISLLLTWALVLFQADWHRLAPTALPIGWVGVSCWITFLPLVISRAISMANLWRLTGNTARYSPLAVFRWSLRQPMQLLLPILLCLGVSDWVLFNPDLWLQFKSYVPLPDWLMLGSVILVVIPLSHRLVLPSRPLDKGPLRDRLLSIASKARVHCNTPHVWLTGHQPISTAMVVGWLPFFRQIYITDHFLKTMSDSQIDAAFAHELAHVRHRHLWIYLCTGVAFLLTLFPWLVRWNVESYFFLGLVVAVFGIYYGRLSRHMEHHADIVSDEITGNTGAIASTLIRLASLSGEDIDKARWHHPSIRDRVVLLMRYKQDPQFRSTFEKHRRKLTMIAFILLLFSGSMVSYNIYKSPPTPAWNSLLMHAADNLEALRVRQTHPGDDSLRTEQLLIDTATWLESGTALMREEDSRHPQLSGNYQMLGSIYARLGRHDEAAACRILADAAQ